MVQTLDYYELILWLKINEGVILADLKVNHRNNEEHLINRADKQNQIILHVYYDTR